MLRKIQYYITISHILIIYFTTITTTTTKSISDNVIPTKFLYDALQTSLSSFWSIPVFGSDKVVVLDDSDTIQQTNDEMLSYFLLVQINQSISKQIQYLVTIATGNNVDNDSTFLLGIMSDFVSLYRRYGTNNDTNSTAGTDNHQYQFLQWTIQFVSNLCCTNWYIALSMLYHVGKLGTSNENDTKNSNITRRWYRFGTLVRCCLGSTVINYIRYRSLEAYNISFMKNSLIDCTEIARLLFMFDILSVRNDTKNQSQQQQDDDDDAWDIDTSTTTTTTTTTTKNKDIDVDDIDNNIKESNNTRQEGIVIVLSSIRAYNFGMACGLPTPDNTDTKVQLQFKTAKVTIPLQYFLSYSNKQQQQQQQRKQQEMTELLYPIQLLREEDAFIFFNCQNDSEHHQQTSRTTISSTSSPTTMTLTDVEYVHYRTIFVNNDDNVNTTTTSSTDCFAIPSVDWFQTRIFF